MWRSWLSNDKLFIMVDKTIDTYIGYLKSAGILKTKSPGTYIIKRKLSKNAKISQVKRLAYDSDWKSWFMNIELFED